MLTKIYKSILIISLLWLLSTLLFVRKSNIVNKIMIIKDKPVFKELHYKVPNKEIRFNKMSFKAWQMIPLLNKEVSGNERYSILKHTDTPPGIYGKPVILKDDLKLNIREKIKRGWKDHAFNQFVSDFVPVNRTLPDVRDVWCKEKQYSSTLPQATVIICFHNEAWSTLLRTVHSVLDRSPRNLLKEVILVDDASSMHYLQSQLDEYIKLLPQVKLIRTDHREGLIRARMLGTGHADTPIVVFLDSHCECIEGWLEPLLQRISENRTIVVSPVIDDIHASTFEYVSQDTQDLQVGGFTWHLKFSWISLPQTSIAERKHDAAPVRTPTIAGGLFAIDKKFFEKLGMYDEEYDIWGAENLELSFKTWMCGGSMEIIPCSHVGHVFRKWFPYKGVKGFQIRNNVRLAEVWLDDYAKYFYERIGNDKGNFGEVTKRKALRAKLKCKPFKWYLENVYPEMVIPDNYVASGQISSLNYDDWCLDSSAKIPDLSKSVSLLPCHRYGGNQYWVYTKFGEIQREGLCLDYMFYVVVLYLCRGKVDSQIWLYDEKTHIIKHMRTRKCLTAWHYHRKYKVKLLNCIDNASNQRWAIENFKPERFSSSTPLI